MKRKYETRRNTSTEHFTWKSQVDWKRTKRDQMSLVPDGDYEQDSSTSDSDSEEDGDVTDGSTSEELQEQQKSTTVVSKEDEEEEEECVALGTRKRTLSVMNDSDSSSDIEVPVRKVLSKRRCIVDEDEFDYDKKDNNQPLNLKEEDKESFHKENTNLRKQMRLAILNELSKKRRSNSNRCFEDSSEETDQEDDQFPLKSAETSDLEDDSSLKDFIVEEEEEEEEKNTEETEDQINPKDRDPVLPKSIFVKHHIPQFSYNSHSDHFKKVVKAFLINAIDSSFLSSLYEGKRQKKYAQEMLTALDYLDNRFIQPRLQNLLDRSRWKERYKERVECYPCVRFIEQNPLNISCHACGLQRYCKFSVVLSGQLYNNETLEVDDFLPHDKQFLKVGSVCADRTRVYHQLRHFKYNLYQKCSSKAEEDETEEGPVKDRVERLFTRLKTEGWIEEQYNLLEDYLNEADYFQEEKMD